MLIVIKRNWPTFSGHPEC